MLSGPDAAVTMLGQRDRRQLTGHRFLFIPFGNQSFLNRCRHWTNLASFHPECWILLILVQHPREHEETKSELLRWHPKDSPWNISDFPFAFFLENWEVDAYIMKKRNQTNQTKHVPCECFEGFEGVSNQPAKLAIKHCPTAKENVRRPCASVSKILWRGQNELTTKKIYGWPQER